MPATDETDRLLQQVNFGAASPESLQQQGQYYFLNKANVDYQGGTTATVKDADGGAVIEDTPMHSNPNEFAPRPLIHAVRLCSRYWYLCYLVLLVCIRTSLYTLRLIYGAKYFLGGFRCLNREVSWEHRLDLEPANARPVVVVVASGENYSE